MAVLARGVTVERVKNGLFNIQLHGGDDRIYPPHIHIYREGHKLSEFSIEVNLAHYLETGGEIQFCRIIDIQKGVDYKSHEQCWKYKHFLQFSEMIDNWLKQKPARKEYLSCQDNLAAALKAFADEADMTQLHVVDKKPFTKKYGSLYTSMQPDAKIIFVMLSMHKKIHRKFANHFSKELIKSFPLAFMN